MCFCRFSSLLQVEKQLRVLTANKHPQSKTRAHNYIKGDKQDAGGAWMWGGGMDVGVGGLYFTLQMFEGSLRNQFLSIPNVNPPLSDVHMPPRNHGELGVFSSLMTPPPTPPSRWVCLANTSISDLC